MKETKRKLIDIDRDTFLSLSILAARQGKKLKHLIQDVLIDYVASNNKPF